mmetsp:Transcript_20389/g.52984  ORF Transcript_20389/g.52984 Transcript_20389/m.52984 type:complete len:610 (-) Transcript_20389:101-1930(-)
MPPMKHEREANVDGEDDANFVEYVPRKHRKLEVLKKISHQRKMPSLAEIQRRREEEETKRKAAENAAGPQSRRNLMEEHERKRREREAAGITREDEIMKEEEEIMARIRADKALKSVQELAKGVAYVEPLKTSWRVPRAIEALGAAAHDGLRKKFHIGVEGADCPPPIPTFDHMKVHPAIVKMLAAKGITRPTPIQMQALPLLLQGRDMVGVAYTGSGKTLTFSLPIVMFALEQQKKMPFMKNEGPYGVIMCPARELARQTYDAVKELTDCLERAGEPPINVILVMGQVDVSGMMRGKVGTHVVVATPGRLKDMLKRRRLTFEVCRYFALDEADRMIDLQGEEDVREIVSYFKGQRQMVLFSATMPVKIKDFAHSALVNPITVNVGRAGAANLDVIQEVEYVKQEAKVMYLLECLQKTPPPVLIFSQKKGDVDDMHEYLLLKGVEAVAIHGGKDQEERDFAIKAFKDGRKDVLVATDVAGKGLDFPNIQHVINFDMPDELEDYVHRIGRTGRCGKTGVATTFINKMVPQITLLDLKHLLMEAKQPVPPFLRACTSEFEADLNVGGVKGCQYCGGLGHRLAQCPKREQNQQKMTESVGRSDFVRDNGAEF